MSARRSEGSRRGRPERDGSNLTLSELTVRATCETKDCPYNYVNFIWGVPECFRWHDNDIDTEVYCIFCRTATKMNNFARTKTYQGLDDEAKFRRLKTIGDTILKGWADILRRWNWGPDGRIRLCLVDFTEDWAEDYALNLRDKAKTGRLHVMIPAPTEGWEVFFDAGRWPEPSSEDEATPVDEEETPSETGNTSSKLVLDPSSEDDARPTDQGVASFEKGEMSTDSAPEPSEDEITLVDSRECSSEDEETSSDPTIAPSENDSGDTAQPARRRRRLVAKTRVAVRILRPQARTQHKRIYKGRVVLLARCGGLNRIARLGLAVRIQHPRRKTKQRRVHKT